MRGTSPSPHKGQVKVLNTKGLEVGASIRNYTVSFAASLWFLVYLSSHVAPTRASLPASRLLASFYSYVPSFHTAHVPMNGGSSSHPLPPYRWSIG